MEEWCALLAVLVCLLAWDFVWCRSDANAVQNRLKRVCSVQFTCLIGSARTLREHYQRERWDCYNMTYQLQMSIEARHLEYEIEYSKMSSEYLDICNLQPITIGKNILFARYAGTLNSTRRLSCMHARGSWHLRE